MKLVTYRYLEQCAVGALSEAGDAVYPIPGAADMSALIADWETLDKAALRQGASLPITDVQLLAPIPHPAQDVIDGRNPIKSRKRIRKQQNRSFGSDLP